MSTGATVDVVKAALYELLKSALEPGVHVTYAYPGTEGLRQAVFLGPHPGVLGPDGAFQQTSRYTSELASIKAGRKWRNEDYDLTISIWTFRPELGNTSEAAIEIDTEAWTIYRTIEDLFADDPNIGLGTDLKFSHLSSVAKRDPMPIPGGWALLLDPTVNVQARLT